MASTDATLEDLKEQFLVCGICEYLYDNETREPRLLPCLHTYCTLCLQKMTKDKSVTCPHCRELHQAPDNDVNTFKKDNNRRELLDFVTVRTKAPELICDLCEDNKEESKAATRCFECAQFLCKKCTKSHRGCKFTKDHEVVNLDQLKESGLDNFTHIQFCLVIGHEHNKLSLYCETCEVIVCIHCTATTHKDADGHRIRNIDEASDEEMEKVRLQLKETEDLRMRTTDIIEKVEQRLASLAQVEKDLNSKIEAMIKNCIEMLHRRQAELKNELSIICSNKGKILDQQLLNAKQHQQNILDSIRFATQTLQHKNPANFLQIRKVITDRFDRFLKEHLDNVPHENDKITLKDINLTEFQKQVLTHGRICNTSIFPLKTIGQIFDLIHPGRQIVLKLQLCDYQGDPQAADGVPLQIDIKDPDDMEVQSEVNYEDNGQVTLTCDVTKQGWYTARVCVLETEVWKGKFQLLTGNETVVPPHGTKANVDFLSLEEARKIYLECPSCHEEFGFEVDGDYPVLLPCLHSLGRKCAIKRLQNFKLQCPMCKIVHQIQNVEEIPTDPTKDVLNQYLAIREGLIPCSYGCENQTNVYCMQCAVFLCEACFTNHRQNLMFCDHRVSLLQEIRDSETLIDISRIPMCSVRGHGKKELIAFCESCDMLVCNTCALSKQHKSDIHNMEIDLMKIYDDKKAAVINGMERLQTKKDDLACLIRAVERERTEAKSDLQKVLNDINEAFCWCEKALQSRRECLTLQASKFATTLIENLDTQLERLRTDEQYIEKTRNMATEKLNFCAKFAFITVEKILSRRIKYLLDKPHDNHPCQISSFRFLKDNIEEATSQTFPNLGLLWIPDVCPWMTEVELISKVFIGEDTRVLSLRLVTFEGNVSKALFQDGMVHAKIIDPEGKALHVNLEARKESCSVLDAYIHPEKAGKHEFNIEILRRTFKAGKGSFVVRVRVSRPIPTPQESESSFNILTIKTETTTTTTAPLNVTRSATTKPHNKQRHKKRISKLTKEGTITTSPHSDTGQVVGTTSTAARASTPIKAQQQSESSSSVLTIITDTMTTAKAPTETAGSEKSKSTKEGTKKKKKTHSDTRKVVGTTLTDERASQTTPSQPNTPDRSPDSQTTSCKKQTESVNQHKLSMSFGEIQCPDFTFDSATVHTATQVTQEGKLLLSPGTDEPSSPSQQFKIYRGTKATRSFKDAGKYYFEVTVSFTVHKKLSERNLVFEVGLCHVEGIDTHHFAGNHKHAISFIVYRDPINGKLTKEFRRNASILASMSSWENNEGLEVRVAYGFLLDTEQRRWTIVDIHSNSILYTFDEIDLSQPLFPVFGCHNPHCVHVTMLLKTGSVIKSIPECLKQN